MARYTGSVCKVCRREGQKLFLKGERCYSDKCAVERRAYPPGQHGQSRRGRPSDYCIRLREKQKVRAMYGVLEKQFRRYFQAADRQRGVTGENLLQLLERRLDNAVFRIGFAVDRNDARQLVRHSHITINGKKVNIPSAKVRPGDVVEVKERSRKLARVIEAIETVDRRGVPGWLEVDRENFRAVVKSAPSREEIGMDIQEQLVVELYSK